MVGILEESPYDPGDTAVLSKLTVTELSVAWSVVKVPPPDNHVPAVIVIVESFAASTSSLCLANLTQAPA